MSDIKLLFSRLCQHRWPAISGMLTFHNSVSGSVTDFMAASSQQIAFGRGMYFSKDEILEPDLWRSIFLYISKPGSSGYVAINNEDNTWSATFTTSLPAGTYCDVVAGPASNGVCAGSSYVSNCSDSFSATSIFFRYAVSSSGTFSATIAPRGALALHVGAKSSSATPVSSSSSPTSTVGSGGVLVNFAEMATTTPGDVGPFSYITLDFYHSFELFSGNLAIAFRTSFWWEAFHNSAAGILLQRWASFRLVSL